MGLQETASFSEFAILGGYHKSWVTQLRHAGRLVLSDDGKRVRVAESFARIKETEDPSRDGVRDRHAATREPAQGQGAGTAAGAPAGDEANDDEGEEALPAGSAAQRRARALARSAELDMRKKERDELVELRQLLPAGEVEQALAGAVVTLRTALENLPDTLAPELAAVRDEAQVRVLMAEAIDRVLENASRAFANITRAAEAE
ncbi:MAG TPA: hypothetical protein VGE88_17480 [Lysobacter sp.]